MGLSPLLVAFPIVVLVAFITASGGSLQGAASPFSICNPDQPACGVSSSSVTIYGCGGSTFPCKIADGCHVPPFPPPAYCAGSVIPIINLNLETTLIPANTTLTVPTVITTLPANGAAGFFFGFGQIGPSGFIALIGLIVGIVCIAGFAFIGTGSESVHILFMGGLMMGIWIFLSGLEGFLGGSSTSFFVELNALSSGIGTAFYVALTFMYLLGFMSMVKRGF